MRVSVLLMTVLAAAFITAGCGGPKDSDKQLAAACERQIQEIADEEAQAGSTPVAKSTTERLDKVTLHQCAGQDMSPVSAAPADEGAAQGDETKDDGATGDDTAPAELDPAARDLFASTCGGCHTLSDAETTGAAGPDLDGTTMTVEEIDKQIVDGGGAMPPGLLEGADATSVAEYVAGAAAAAAS